MRGRGVFQQVRSCIPTKRRLLALLLGGLGLLAASCSPLRHYEFARYTTDDDSAGDVTHASQPGARVVVLKQKIPTAMAHYRFHDAVALNDLITTPGKVRTTDKNDPAVCGGGSTKPYRKPGIQSVYAEYGAKKQKGICCEIDHLISLEIGGDNGVENEWPQPYEPRPGAHEKDLVENWLHAQVCAGKMTLPDAQKQIAQDWYAVYLKMEAAK